MNKSPKLVATALCAGYLMLGSFSAYAGGQGVSEANLTSIHMEEGVTFLSFDEVISNPDNCASNVTILLSSEIPNQQGYLSMAMTALAAGKPVSVWVEGCGWSPWAVVPKLYAMQIKP